MDYRTTTSTTTRMDRIYNLWRKKRIQRGDAYRRRRWTTECNQSKGNDAASATYTTGDTTAQSHTHAIQELVSCVHTISWQTDKPPTANIETASHTSWFHLHQDLRRQMASTNSDGHRHTDRHVDGNNAYRQERSVRIRTNIATSIHSWMWQIRRHTTEWPRRIPDGAP